MGSYSAISALSSFPVCYFILGGCFFLRVLRRFIFGILSLLFWFLDSTESSGIIICCVSMSDSKSLSSGHAMPTVGLGTWKIEKDQCQEIVYTAIKVIAISSSSRRIS